MKYLTIILLFVNLMICCGSVLFVLKDIIHNENSSITMNSFILALVCYNYFFYIKSYREYLTDESEQD